MTINNDLGTNAPKLMRRTFLISSATTALVAGFAASAKAKLAGFTGTAESRRCAEEHVSISRKLAEMLNHPSDAHSSSQAIKTASCRHCNTQIGLSEV